MNELRILLLGAPAVIWMDAPVQIQRRLQRALLYYLAQRGAMVGRSDLIFIFWPKDNEEVARKHLRESLSRLRADLPDPTYLVTESDQVGLDFSHVTVDSLDFERLIQQVGRIPWQISESTPLPDALYQPLAKAAALWRSSHFLAGANLPSLPDLDDWLIMTTQQLERERMNVLQRLSLHAEAQGDFESALNWQRMALENDVLDIEGHRKVLTLLFRLGRHEQAQKYGDYLMLLFEREYDGDPPEELLDLLKLARRDASQPTSSIYHRFPISRSLHLPFVGRGDVINQLTQVYQRGGIVAIRGESGVGKSRLVQEFYNGLLPPPRLLMAQARPLEGNLPFQPLIDLLRISILPEEWRTLPSIWLETLTVLLPELSTICPGIHPTTFNSTGPARTQIFEALRQLLLTVAKKQRILFVMGDAHWADEATLAALAYLMERDFFQRSGLLILTMRTEEIGPQLDALLNRPYAIPVEHNITLPLLDTKETARLIESAMDSPPPDSLVTQMIQDTGGNPLFLLETLRTMFELSIDPSLYTENTPLPLAGSIYALVQRRIQHLSPTTRQVITAAAVIGNHFSLAVLEQTSRMEAEQVAVGLDELESVCLVTFVSSSPKNEYAFVHDKIRESILLELTPARARLLHMRAAQAMQDSLGEQAIQQAAVLAQHYESAGEFLTAFDAWLKAAQHARNLYSPGEAYRAYSHAEAILGQLQESLADELVYALYSEWGALAYEIEDRDTLRLKYEKLHTIGLLRTSPLLIGTALSGLSNLSFSVNAYEEGARLTEQAIEQLQQTDQVVELIEAFNRRGRFLVYLNRYADAIASFERALKIGEEIHGVSVQQARVNVFFHLSMTRMMCGQIKQACSEAEVALHEGQNAGYSFGQARAYSSLAITHLFANRLHAAQEYVRSGLELSQRLQTWRISAYLNYTAAHIAMVMGNVDQAWDQVHTAKRLADKYGYSEIQTTTAGLLGNIYQQLHEPESAMAWYSSRMDDPSYESLDNRYRRGVLLGSMGRLEEGLKTLEEVIAFSQPIGIDGITYQALMGKVSLLYQLGDIDSARKLALRVEEETVPRNMGLIPILAGMQLAQISLQRGDAQAARVRAEAAVEQTRAIGVLWHEINALRLRIVCRRACGEDISSPDPRLVELVSYVDAHLHNPDLLPLWQRCRGQYLSE